jgi:hypothetical protein
MPVVAPLMVCIADLSWARGVSARPFTVTTLAVVGWKEEEENLGLQ